MAQPPVRTHLALLTLLLWTLTSCGREAPQPGPLLPSRQIVTNIVPEDRPELVDPAGTPCAREDSRDMHPDLGGEEVIVLLSGSPEKEALESDKPFDGRGFLSNLGVGGGGGGSFGGRLGGGRRGGQRQAGPPVPAQAPAPGGEEAGAIRQGQLQARDSGGELVGEFPLQHTRVEAEISGFLASTHVTQVFANPFEEVVEAVYVFPLPTEAAVHDFVMEVAGRRIVGLVRRRAEAERIYREARAQGYTASLLTQERANLFRQSVANIEPGGSVDVHITYVHTLPYEQGEYAYVFPMVVGPRYIPGIPGPSAAPPAGSVTPAVAGPVGGGGLSPDTDQVPDASRITPPVLEPGQRSGHDIAVRIDLDAGVPLGQVSVPTHEVSVRRVGDRRALVELVERDRIPNRDLELRYRVAGEELQPGLLAHRSERHGGFFTLQLVPQLEPTDAQVTPREVTFIMDISGSMRGLPLSTSKEVVRRTLASLRPDDRFNIVVYASGSGRLASGPIDNTEANIARALAYLEGLQGSGGTEMLSGLRAYLATMQDSRYVRLVCFLTDGFVGNEEQIHATIKREGQDARWFGFGIGSSVNRHLIEGIGRHGRGASHIVLPREEAHAAKAVERFLACIDSPVLVDLAVDTGDLPVTDLEPRVVHDLFAGQPLQLIGRYTGAADGTITLRGRVGDRPVALPFAVELPEQREEHAALSLVWARRRIASLSEELLGQTDAREREDLERRITELALDFKLASQFTSFVAVDESRVVGDGNPIRVLQPVELPEGVSYEGAVGAEPVGQPVSVPAWGLLLAQGRDGSIAVLEVSQESPAAAQGIAAGDRLVTAARTMVRGLRHLESLLLQEGGATVELGFRSVDQTGKEPSLHQVRLALVAASPGEPVARE